MTSDALLSELYQDIIIDHNKNPRHFYVPENYTHCAEGFNPLCGDQLTVYLNVLNILNIKDAPNLSEIHDISFTGQGCAISMASASLMTEILHHKSVEEAKSIFHYFHELLTTADEKDEKKETLTLMKNPAVIQKLAVLKGVRQFPARVKCATLAWHAFCAALKNKNKENKTVSTE